MNQLEKLEEAEQKRLLDYQEQILKQKQFAEQQKIASQRSFLENGLRMDKETNDEILQLNAKIKELENKLIKQPPQHGHSTTIPNDRKTISNIATNTANIAFLQKSIESLNKQFCSLADFLNKRNNNRKRAYIEEDETNHRVHNKKSRKKRIHDYQANLPDDQLDYQDPYYPEDEYCKQTRHK